MAGEQRYFTAVESVEQRAGVRGQVMAQQVVVHERLGTLRLQKRAHHGMEKGPVA